MWVEQTRDRQRLSAFLEGDRGWGAYALGDLEPGMFERAEWYLAGEGTRQAAGNGRQATGVPSALCMVFRGLTPPPLFCMGDAEGIRAILTGLTVTPVFLNVSPRHLATVTACYRAGALIPMWRMILSPESFHPAGGPAARLSLSHLAQVQIIYGRAFGGDTFAEYQLHEGIYFGVFVGNQLVSVAGTHVISLEHGVAAVGNVATLAEYRNQGFAQAATGAVCGELHRLGIQTVVLNVRQGNAPAIRAYQKLGFTVHCEFLEGIATRASTPEQGGFHA